jgi:hypothetical protein
MRNYSKANQACLLLGKVKKTDQSTPILKEQLQGMQPQDSRITRQGIIEAIIETTNSEDSPKRNISNLTKRSIELINFRQMQ